MNEMLAILDRDDVGDLRVAGMVTRDVAHRRGVPHGSALVAVVVGCRAGGGIEPALLLQRRATSKDVCPGLWDIFGGHLQGSSALLEHRALWHEASYMQALFDETALREVNEECLVLDDHGTKPWPFGPQHLSRFGRIGEYEHGLGDPMAHNREYSTFYGAFVPADVLMLGPNVSAVPISVSDSVPTGAGSATAATEVMCLSWPSVLDRFNHSPEAYADGIGRILSKAASDPCLTEAIGAFLRAGLRRTTG